MFSNNALKTYQRLNKVLKKDKTQDEGYLVNENVKWDIEKAIATYMEIQQSSSNVSIQTKNDEMYLTYTVKVKRIKEFITY